MAVSGRYIYPLEDIRGLGLPEEFGRRQRGHRERVRALVPAPVSAHLVLNAAGDQHRAIGEHCRGMPVSCLCQRSRRRETLGSRCEQLRRRDR